jgi:hypothetical protein
VLIFAEDRDECVAQADEATAGDRVVGDYKTGLAIDQRDRSAQAASPEAAPIGFAGFSGVSEGPERASGVDLLGASVSRLEHNRYQREKRGLEQP